MKPLNFISLWLIIGLIPSVFTLRFGTYNIQSGSNVQHVYNLSETARTINALGVDIIALQEVDNFTTRHPVDQTSFIVHYDPQRLFQYSHFEKMRDFQNGGYGISILSRHTSIARTLTYHYSNTTAGRCALPTEGDYCQGLVLVEIPWSYPGVSDLSVYFGTTHFGIGLNDTQQLNEAKQLVKWITETIISVRRSPYLILMTGDYNSIPTDEAIRSVMHSLFDDLWTPEGTCERIIDPDNRDGDTFDSLRPSKRIDYVFLLKSDNFPAHIKLNCTIQVVPTLASDHRPVLVDFELL